jgi:hypothetical protein
MTPLVASMSVITTWASLTITLSPSTLMETASPDAVSALFNSTT